MERSVATRFHLVTTSQLQFLISFILGFFLIVAIQWVKFGALYPYVFNGTKPTVDRDRCNCTCWDTWFKGQYERWPGVYHHVYFNRTWQTGVLWLITVLYVLALYECVRYVVAQVWVGSFRAFYLVLFIFFLYSHHYTWWVYFGYFNDDFYGQAYHQALFSITEAWASWIVLGLATSRSPLSVRNTPVNRADFDREISNLWILGAISFGHLSVGSLDQFIDHNIMGNGEFFQRLRNWGLIIPDALGVGSAVFGLSQFYSPYEKFKLLTLNNRHIPLSFKIREISSSVLHEPHPHFYQAAFVFCTFVLGCSFSEFLQLMPDFISTAFT